MKRRFTLLDLLLVVLVCALAVGWWVDRSRLRLAAEQWEEGYREVVQQLDEVETEFARREEAAAREKDRVGLSQDAPEAENAVREVERP